MRLIQQQLKNNFFIFGKLDCINAVPLLKDLKAKAPQSNFTYISIIDHGLHGGIVISSVSEQLEALNYNSDYCSLFKSLGVECTEIFSRQVNNLSISTSVTFVINMYMDIDSDAQNRLLKADYSSTIIDLSRQRIEIAGHQIKDIETFHFNDLHKFDDFATRMTNFKEGTNDQLLSVVKYNLRMSL